MSNCYACEFKQYKHSNQTPKFDGSCPGDCVILIILKSLGASVRTIPRFTALVATEYPELISLLIDSGTVSESQIAKSIEVSRQ